MCIKMRRPIPLPQQFGNQTHKSYLWNHDSKQYQDQDHEKLLEDGIIS